MQLLCNDDDRCSRVGDCLRVVSLRERNSTFINIYIYPEPLVASVILSIPSRDFIRRTLYWNFPTTFRSHLRLRSSIHRGELLLITRDTFESAGIHRPYVDYCNESRRCKPEFYGKRRIFGESDDAHDET